MSEIEQPGLCSPFIFGEGNHGGEDWEGVCPAQRRHSAQRTGHLYSKMTDASPRIKLVVVVFLYTFLNVLKIQSRLTLVVIGKYCPRNCSSWCSSPLLSSFSQSHVRPLLSCFNHICRIKFHALTVMLSKAPNQFFNHSTFLAVIKNMCPLIKLMRNC